MSETSRKRKSQAERRAQSRQAVLSSATRLFGQQGYADTSLEEIAADCGLTIRPIYHYFGNKKALFAAVNEVMEERILGSMQVGAEGEAQAGIVGNWRSFLDLCDDPGFRRIVLVDSPNILGRERWSGSAVMKKARTALEGEALPDAREQYRAALINRVVMGAFTEAALMIAESDNIQMAKEEAEGLMVALFSKLRGQLSVPLGE